MRIKKIRPYVLIVWTFVLVILIGACLLALPVSSKNKNGLGFVNSIFMSTSAVCVTGLSVVDVSLTLSLFGKIVMAILMEIGGLSFITIAVFFFTVFGAKIGVSNKFLLKESLNQNSMGGIVELVRKIIITAFVIQIFGFILNIFALYQYCDCDFWKTCGYSAFHTIASFNNAGFDIFGANSMIDLKDNVFLNINTMLLIVFGSIGFVVLMDLLDYRKTRHLKLHTKITLIATFLLIILGAIFLKLTIKDISWLQAFFTSITCRTAGFTTYDFSKVSGAGFIVSVVLMFIGASPCSTGGGIKTTTFAVLIIAMFYYARGKKNKVFKRTISESQIEKAYVLTTISMFIVLFTTFLITMIQPTLKIDAALFESCSAFSTTGLSMGITQDLVSANRIIISCVMFIGRLGPLTIIGLINKTKMANEGNIKYIEESVIIG